MSRLSYTLVAAVLLLAVRVVSAAPCIECRDCRTDNCWRQCSQVCPNNRPPPIVNGDQCRRKGNDFGMRASRDACETTRRFCNGGQRPMAAKTSGSIGLVTRKQCANIAFGQCQQTAMDTRRSPCGREMRSGFRQCNARQFMDFYTGEVNDLCARQAATITN